MNPDPDLTIVLLGKAGVGKSASGNTILGRTQFESKNAMTPVTKEISEEKGNVLGKQISVVDTPGILDTEETESEIKEYCQKLLQSTRRCLFLVVVRAGRFTEEDQKSVRKAIEVLGELGLKNTYLLFTGGDSLKNKSLEDFIFEDEAKLPDVVQRFEGAYHLFNNEVDDEEQVRDLLIKSGLLTTQEPPESPADVSKARRVVLLGLPGAGKSSSGNTILGSERFKSGCGFDSVSTESVSQSALVESCEVTVVDTVGFTEVLTSEQLYLEIMKMMVTASPGPHAFVIVVRLGRITNADVQLFKALPQLFTSEALKYSMVLFTHGDELKGQSMEEMIQSNTHVSQLVSLCGGRYCVFDNRANRKREQVRTFLTKVDEMVTANGGQHFTNDMFKMAKTFLKEERFLYKVNNLFLYKVKNQKAVDDEVNEAAWKRLIPYILAGLIGIGIVAYVVVTARAGAAETGAAAAVVGTGAAAAVVGTGATAAVVGTGAAAAVVGTGAAAAVVGTGAAAAVVGTGAAAAVVGTGAAAAVVGTGAAAAVVGTGAAAAVVGTGAAAAVVGTGAAAVVGTGAAAAVVGTGAAAAVVGTGAAAVVGTGAAAAVGTGEGIGIGAAVVGVVAALGERAIK